MDNSDVITVLKKLKSVLKHVPGMGQVLTVAVLIAQQVQDFQDARDDCLELGQQALTITLRLCDHLRRQTCGSATRENIKRFVSTLEGVSSVMNIRLRKGFMDKVTFWFNTGNIAKKTRKSKRKLEAAAQLFVINISIDNADKLQRVENMCHELLKQLAHVGGNPKIIKEDITEVQGAPKTPDARRWNDEPPEYMDLETVSLLPAIEVDKVRATRLTPVESEKGKVTVVRRGYPKTKGGFVDAPTIAKDWPGHPYILPIIRNKSSDLTDEGCIVTEGYQSFEEYSKSLTGFDKLRGMLSALQDLCEAANYLDEQNLRNYILDRPTSRWCLTEGRDIEQSELIFDLRSRHVKWRLKRPIAGSVIIECPDQIPLFGLPAWSSSRKQLLEQLREGLGQDDLKLAETWFRLLQTQTSLLALHREATIREPPNLESLVPVGTWLVPTQTSPLGYAQLSPLKIDNFKMELQHAPHFLFMHEEDRPEGTRLDTDDYPLVTIFRAKVYPSDAYYTRYGRTTFGDEVDIDLKFLDSDTAWKGRRFPNVSFGTTLSFPQHLRSNFTMVQALPSLTDAILDKETSIVTASTYIVETTRVRTAYAEPRALPAPLWFFILKHDNIHDYPLSREVPWGFWSTEENPTFIPPDITFSPPHRARDSGFPFAWMQMIDGRAFHIRARVALECMTLTQDEALVLKRCRSTPDSAEDKDKDQTTSEDEAESDNKQQTAPLSFQVMVLFLAVVLFLNIASSIFTHSAL